MEGRRRDEMLSFTCNIYQLCGFSDLKERTVTQATFFTLKRALKKQVFIGLPQASPVLSTLPPGQEQKGKKRGDFRLLSLQLLRRYKQHLANSAPNGSKCSELQGLILCYPPSIYTGFRQALHRGDQKHWHSRRLGQPWPRSLAGRMEGFCNPGFCNPDEATNCSLTQRSPGHLAGAAAAMQGLQRGAHLPEEEGKPSRGCANVCPETTSMPFKICIYTI